MGQRLLPGENEKGAAESREDRADLMRTYQLEDRLWEVLILNNSSWVGKRLQEIGIGSEHGLTVLSVVRHDEPQLLNRLDFILKKDDMLLVSGRRTRVDKLVQEHADLKVLGHPSEPEKFPSSSGELIEVVVPPRSPVVGKTMADLDFRSETCLTGVAIWRADNPPFEPMWEPLPCKKETHCCSMARAIRRAATTPNRVSCGCIGHHAGRKLPVSCATWASGPP